MRILISLAVLCFLYSCNGTGSSDTLSYDSSIVPEKSNQTSIDTGRTIMVPDSQQIIQMNNQATPEIGKPSLGMGALNPEHGKPGHRCDIAVGAPLNSTPSTGAVANQTTTTTTATPVKTATGMNPEHGQPGHRCDIEVGAPLNSPPTKKIPTAQPNTPVTVETQPQAPVQLQPIINNGDSAVGR